MVGPRTVGTFFPLNPAYKLNGDRCIKDAEHDLGMYFAMLRKRPYLPHVKYEIHNASPSFDAALAPLLDAALVESPGLRRSIEKDVTSYIKGEGQACICCGER